MGVFWSRGYRGTALPDLLRATKLSRGSLYAAFGGKHALFLRALDRYIADALARIVIQNALLLGRRRASALTIPWCTYTDPQVAHVGLSPDSAHRRQEHVQTITVPLAEVDRGVLDDETGGFLRVHHRRGRIVGCTIVSSQAGDLIVNDDAMGAPQMIPTRRA